MSLASFILGTGPSGFGHGSTAQQVARGLDLGGLRVLLTGCSSGLGRETLRVLTARGAHVLGTARTAEKAAAACAVAPDRTTPLVCELSAPASVRACVAAAREGPPLDVIIANAGVMALPERRPLHGIEHQLFVNHVAHFMLITGLLDHLRPGARIVVLSSGAHRRAPAEGIDLDDLAVARGYTPWSAYGRSKLANLLFVRELARRIAGSGRVVNAVHPGVIETPLNRHLPWRTRILLPLGRHLFFKTVAQGAATQVWAAVHPDAAALNGEYLKDCQVARSTRNGRDMAAAARLWQVTERVVAGLPGG